MRSRFRPFCYFLMLFGIVLPAWSKSEPIYLAVEANIQGPIKAICQKFSQSTNYDCQITATSAGHLYAHIMHGVTYDLLLSSDEIYVQGLINAKRADAETRFTLATGKNKDKNDLIELEMILLKSAQHKNGALELIQYLRGEESCKVLRNVGLECNLSLRAEA